MRNKKIPKNIFVKGVVKLCLKGKIECNIIWLKKLIQTINIFFCAPILFYILYSTVLQIVVSSDDGLWNQLGGL